MAQVTALIHEYLRHDKKFPHVWCPGCGNFGIFTSLQAALNKLNLHKEKVVIVTDVGCAGNSADFYSTYVFENYDYLTLL